MIDSESLIIHAIRVVLVHLHHNININSYQGVDNVNFGFSREEVQLALYPHHSTLFKRFEEEPASDYFEELSEAFNPNRQKVGRIIKIRRRIRRDKKGKIVIQKNKRKSAIKGFRISGNKVVRVSAVSRMKKSRNLKKFWRSKGRSKLRRTLLKRKMSMNRRKAIGLK